MTEPSDVHAILSVAEMMLADESAGDLGIEQTLAQVGTDAVSNQTEH